MFYCLITYSFDSERPILGPFFDEQSCWKAMQENAREEHRIDTEENEYETEYKEDFQSGEITLTDIFPDRNDTTSWLMFEIETQQRSIIVERNNGGEKITFSMRFLCLKKDIDLYKAIQDAVCEYLHTPDGQKLYEYSCHEYNWLDLAANPIPEEICRKHGFLIIDKNVPEDVVMADDDLSENMYDD